MRSPIKIIKTTEHEDEKTILAFMVMHDDVTKAVHTFWKTKQLKLKHISTAYRRQFRNIIKFYEKYNEAPRRAIKFIHDGEKAILRHNKDELKLNSQVLKTIAEEYSANREGYLVNSQYIIEELIPRFIRIRKTAEINEKLSIAVENGLSDEAERLLLEYDKVQTEQKDPTFGFTTPLTLDYQLDMLARFDDEGTKEVYRFPDALGALIGPLKKGWLVAISGATKASKSYFLGQIAFDAVLNQGKKVMYLCPDMSEEDMNEERIVSYITDRASSKELAGNTYLPEFDCIKNQTGECKDRPKGRVPLLKKPVSQNPNSVKEQILADSIQCLNWKTCTKCRFENPKRYSAAIYFRKKRIKSFKITERQNRLQRRKFKPLKYKHGQNFKIKYFPKYQATIEDCFDVIHGYIETNDWQPDIIIFDYIDILNPGRGEQKKSFNDYRDYDHMWKTASRLAQETDTLVLTADQSTKAGRTARLLDETSTSQASMKDHHLNVKIGIGKIKEETQNNIARVNVLFHRHRPFNRNLEVLVTQNLTCANAFVDSAFWFDKTSPPYNIQIPQNEV